MATQALRFAFYTENTVVGGSERYLRDLIGGVAARGHAVRLGCNPDPDLLASMRTGLPELPIDVLPIGTLSRSVAFRLGQATGLDRASTAGAVKRGVAATTRLTQFVRNVRVLRQWLQDARPDVLHINNGGYPGGESCRAAAAAGRLAGVPVVGMAIHNLAERRRWPVSLEAALDRLVGHCLDTTIVASRASGRTLTDRRGFEASRLVCIPYGVEIPVAYSPSPLDCERLGVPARGPLIGTVARLEPRKGQAYLLQAAALARRAIPNLHIMLVGSGPAEGEYRALAERLCLGDHVTFTGQRHDINDLLRIFDVFVMPSVDFESLPFALLEAMAMGVPIVATRVAGMPEAVRDGENGLLVAPRAVEELATAMVRLLRDPVERRRLGQAARARAREEYNLTRMIERTCDLYASLYDRAIGACPASIADGPVRRAVTSR